MKEAAADDAATLAQQSQERATEAAQTLAQAEIDAADAKGTPDEAAAQKALEDAQAEVDKLQPEADEDAAAAKQAQNDATGARNKADQAKTDADNAQAEADKLQSQADEDAAAAKQAQDDADQAKADAEQAKADAEQAQADAEQAQADADQDAAAAKQAQDDADQAKAEADQAQATADETKATADAAAAEAEKLQATADEANAAADQAQATADEAKAAADAAAAEAAKLQAAAEEAQKIADEIANAPKAKDTCAPVYEEVTVNEGETAYVAAPKFTDQETGEERDMPEGTKFAFKDAQDSGIKIDENTGEITDVPTYAAPAKNVYEVLVTYPDGSTDTVAATVNVVAPNTDDKDLYQPAYEEVTVEQGETAYVAAPKYTSAETGEEIDAPAARYALKDGEIQGVEIDEETGAITVHATDAAPAKNVYEVLVTYSDGTTEVVVATVNVVETPQAKLYQPVYTPAEVERGKVGTIEAPKFTDQETGEERDMPEGTQFSLKDGEIKGVKIDPETGAITVESTYAAVENVYEVLVTYADGSSEVVVATINVIDTPVDGSDDGTDEPGDGTEEPGNGTEEPGNGTEEPGNGTEEPGDDADEPGDAGTDRPTKPVKVVPAKGGRHALPRTGAETGGLLAAAASLLAGGAALVTRRRKNEQ